MRIQGNAYAKNCAKCRSQWRGIGQPRPRQCCESCGSSLHSCANCHHFDKEITNSCALPQTTFVGDRELMNYCDHFEMVNAQVKAIEARTQRARNVWEQLFR